MERAPWVRLRRRAWGRRLLGRLLGRRTPAPYGPLPPLVVNGFPKGGTHLLVRCVSLLGGEQRHDFFLARQVDRWRWLLGLDSPTVEEADAVPLGIGEPTWLPVREVERRLARLRPGEFVAGHIPYSEAFAELVNRLGLRTLLILRDPRDALVSLVDHITSRSDHRLHEYFTQTLHTPEERLLASIRGVSVRRGGKTVSLRDIGERLKSVQPWTKLAMNYTARFERLVGPAGGGSAEEQEEEVRHVAAHVGLSLTPEQVRQVASQVFWEESLTFRRGQLGSWRDHFNDEHRAAFKALAGQQLIELGYETSVDW
ncbi:MAG: sulfotransferase domain-containing protein [Acidobacteria bacterium]|nr:sulfotransferase domain-containing protein [Acidobacteriota bacterium]